MAARHEMMFIDGGPGDERSAAERAQGELGHGFTS
jgi:hypothetical protein